VIPFVSKWNLKKSVGENTSVAHGDSLDTNQEGGAVSFWGKKSETTDQITQPLSRPAVDAVELPVTREGDYAMTTTTTPKQEDVSRTSPSKKTSPPAKEVATGRESLGAQSQEQVEDLILSRFGKTRSALGPGTVVQGKLAFDTPVRIDGELSGELSSSKVIVVGSTGRIVDADINTADLVVFGYVKGNITVSGRLEILGNGFVEGTIEAAQLVVDGQGCLLGSCRMAKYRAASLLTQGETKRTLLPLEIDSQSSEHQGTKGDLPFDQPFEGEAANAHENATEFTHLPQADKDGAADALTTPVQ
jgi:cytoskeletal protein CcmA (bactofilin family)